jgi:hypothetical protein
MPIFLKSGSLNLLEPSGRVKACNGIALPLAFTHWLLELVDACNETNLKRYLSSIYSVTIPLHVSGLLAAQHQNVAM